MSAVVLFFLFVGLVVFPDASSVGKELFFYQYENRPGFGCLSFRPESNECNVYRTGSDPGAGVSSFLPHKCGNIWRCRNRSHPSGRRHNTSAGANQAKHTGCTELISAALSMICINE